MIFHNTAPQYGGTAGNYLWWHMFGVFVHPIISHYLWWRVSGVCMHNKLTFILKAWKFRGVDMMMTLRVNYELVDCGLTGKIDIVSFIWPFYDSTPNSQMVIKMKVIIKHHPRKESQRIYFIWRPQLHLPVSTIKLIWVKYQNFYMFQNCPRILGFQKIYYSLLDAIRPMELFKTYVVEQRRQIEAKYHWLSVFRQWCCICSRQVIA